MMTCEEMLSAYEAIGRITGEMLAAAKGAQWDQLVELEKSCSAVVSRLRDGGEVALSAAGRERKIALIRQILDDDRKIRDLTQPWMARLTALINNNKVERRIAAAYGV
jgi:flagellar protein FliT